MINKNQSNRQPHTKSNERCFVCNKKGHYGKDCCLQPKKKLPKEEVTGEEVKPV